VITIFRDKSILTIFSLIAICLFTHLHIFFVPVILHATKNSGLIADFIDQYGILIQPFVLNIIYIIIIFIQAIRLNIILNNQKLFSKSGFTTALAFILFSGLFTNTYEISAALIANSLVIWIFSFSIKLYNNSSPKSLLYNLGLLASCSILLYKPLALITVGLLFALLILRSFKIAEWLIFILGLITPIYILISALYLTDNLDYINHFILNYSFNFELKQETWYLISVSTIVLLTLAGLVTWYPNSNRMVIQSRKSWAVILIFFLLSICGILILNNFNFYAELLCLVPCAAFVSNFFLYPSKKILINFFLIVIAVIVVHQNWLMIQG
jgi:hypothetical protein